MSGYIDQDGNPATPIGPIPPWGWDTPFIDLSGEPTAKQPPLINVKRPHLAELGPASIEWGAAAQFTVLTLQRLFPFETGTTIPPNPAPKKPNDPKPPKPTDPTNPPGQPVGHWQEMGRSVQMVRIENPDDSTQFVDVERIESILFRAPDGSYQQFDLNNSSD